MPAYAPLKEVQAGQPLDLSNIKYPISERFSSAFSNRFEHMSYTNIVNNFPQHITPQEGYPGTQPVTQDDINEWKSDRPGLPNIPLGIPKFLGNSAVSLYDNDKNLSEVSEAPAGIIGSTAAFGGYTAASLLNLKATAVGAFTGGFVRNAVTTLGRAGLMALGGESIFGSKAAQVFFQMGEKGAEFGTFNAAAQTYESVQEEKARTVMQQPHEYINDLQKIGVSGLEGIVFGAFGSGAGQLLRGTRAVRLPTGKIEYREAQAGEKQLVQGGVLNRSEFSHVPEGWKKKVAASFRPWSKESNVTMVEEATGQMMNGQYVKVDPIMKQGIFDSGEQFKQALRDGGVDIEVVAKAVDNAHANVRDELVDIINQQKSLEKSNRLLEEGEEAAINENKELSQAGIAERFRTAQRNENLFEGTPERVPANIKEHFKIQDQIDALKQKLERESQTTPNVTEINPELGANDVVRESPQPNKKVVQRIKQLEKRQPKILTPKRELQSIRDELTSNLGEENYASTDAYKRLEDLAKVWKAAERLKNNLDLRHDFEQKLNNLTADEFLLNTLSDHLNSNHEPVSPADMKQYSDQLRSTGIPETEPESKIDIEGNPDAVIDDYIKQYQPDDVKSITDALNDPEYTAELDRQFKRFNGIETMKKMVASVRDCLLKGDL